MGRPRRTRHKEEAERGTALEKGKVSCGNSSWMGRREEQGGEN